jgi:hypothetical protein
MIFRRLEVQFGPTQLLTACTASVTLPECDKFPLVAVIVRVELAAGVELEVEMFSVDEPELVTEAGAKLALAPAGRPPTVKATAPANPFTGAIVAV